MNPRLQAIFAKHGVGMFEVKEFGDGLVVVRTDKETTQEFQDEFKLAIGGGAVTFALIGELAQPALPGFESLVNHPSHYNSGKIEVIEAIEDWRLGFNRGNAVKYVARAGKKNPTKEIEDLEKAVWYLKRELELLKSRDEKREPVRPNDMNPRASKAVTPPKPEPLPVPAPWSPKSDPKPINDFFSGVWNLIRINSEVAGTETVIAFIPSNQEKALASYADDQFGFVGVTL